MFEVLNDAIEGLAGRVARVRQHKFTEGLNSLLRVEAQLPPLSQPEQLTVPLTQQTTIETVPEKIEVPPQPTPDKFDQIVKSNFTPEEEQAMEARAQSDEHDIDEIMREVERQAVSSETRTEELV